MGEVEAGGFVGVGFWNRCVGCADGRGGFAVEGMVGRFLTRGGGRWSRRFGEMGVGDGGGGGSGGRGDGGDAGGHFERWLCGLMGGVSCLWRRVGRLKDSALGRYLGWGGGYICVWGRWAHCLCGEEMSCSKM